MEDRERWNIKHQTMPMPTNPSKIIEKYISYANTGKALDIACGTGRNTTFLVQHGFYVDAVDVSDYALSQIPPSSSIHTIHSDLATFEFESHKYDLICNINFLDRRLFPKIQESLAPKGVLIFETFIIAHGEAYSQPRNIDYVLRKNELLHAFIGLDIIYYEEHDDVNLRGEKVRLASIVCQKKN